MKLLVIDALKSFSLVSRFREQLSERCEVWEMATICDARTWGILDRLQPDVILVEFADANAAVLSQRIGELSHRPRVVVRLHGYESADWFLNRVAWENVDRLVAVSPWFEQMLRAKVGSRVKVQCILNGVDCSRFPAPGASTIDALAVAYLGYLNMKKGPALLRLVAASLPERRVHIGGIFQDEPTERLFTGARLENLELHGWVKPEEFLPGKQWILTTSVTESFSFAICEGMAAGLTPLVHAWPGAELLWPAECLWRTIEELRAIAPKDPTWCRRWVEERYPLTRAVDQFSELLMSLG